MELDRSRIVNGKAPEELVRIGTRYSSKEMLVALADLLPLARANAGTLPGYDGKLLAELEYVAAKYVEESDARSRRRCEAKEGSQVAERRAVTRAKWVLRQGERVLAAAIDTRSSASGETAAARERATAELRKRLGELEGRTDYDAARLATRLRAARVLADDPRIAGRVTELQGSGFDLRGELDGLLYCNLKALVTAGRTWFTGQGDRARASTFTLARLHRPARSSGKPVAPEAEAGPTVGPGPTPAA